MSSHPNLSSFLPSYSILFHDPNLLILSRHISVYLLLFLLLFIEADFSLPPKKGSGKIRANASLDSVLPVPASLYLPSPLE